MKDINPGIGQLVSDIGGTSYDRARDAIRKDIIDGYFENGKHLTTTELARRYQLSLAPIREALHQLSAEGIIQHHPNRGAIVRSVTPEFLDEIYEIKLALIPYLEGARAKLASDADVERMAMIEAQYEVAVATNKTAEAITLNRDFHRAQMAIKPNREARTIIGRHNGLIEALRLRFGFGVGRQEETIQEHRAIVEAYRMRSSQDAHEMSRRHLKNAYEDLRRLILQQ